MSNSLWPHGWQPCLLRPWNFPGKNIGVGCHFQLQGHLPNLGIKPASLVSPALAGRLFFFTTSAAWELHSCIFTSSCLFPFHDEGFSCLRSGSSREGAPELISQILKLQLWSWSSLRFFRQSSESVPCVDFASLNGSGDRGKLVLWDTKKAERLWCTVTLTRGQGLYNMPRPWRCVVLINVFPQ